MVVCPDLSKVPEKRIKFIAPNRNYEVMGILSDGNIYVTDNIFDLVLHESIFDLVKPVAKNIEPMNIPSAYPPQHKNIVDEFVKEHLITYFDIMPTRMHVLEFALLSIGHGLHWEKNNDNLYIIAPTYRAEIKEELPSFESDNKWVSNYPMSQDRMANIEFQNLLRDWTRKHIDVICAHNFRFNGASLEPPKPSPNCLNYGLITQSPSIELIHPDWRKAMWNFACQMITQIRQETNATHDYPEAKEWLKAYRPDLAEPFEACYDTMEKLNSEFNVVSKLHLISP